jgi:hypothetical protein
VRQHLDSRRGAAGRGISADAAGGVPTAFDQTMRFAAQIA